MDAHIRTLCPLFSLFHALQPGQRQHNWHLDHRTKLHASARPEEDDWSFCWEWIYAFLAEVGASFVKIREVEEVNEVHSKRPSDRLVELPFGDSAYTGISGFIIRIFAHQWEQPSQF